MPAQEQRVYVIQGPGVRLARRVWLQGRATRSRHGRIEACVEVARCDSFAIGVSKAHWIDAALVFEDHDAAHRLWQRAREARSPSQTIPQAAVELATMGVR